MKMLTSVLSALFKHVRVRLMCMIE